MCLRPSRPSLARVLPGRRRHRRQQPWTSIAEGPTRYGVSPWFSSDRSGCPSPDVVASQSGFETSFGMTRGGELRHDLRILARGIYTVWDDVRQLASLQLLGYRCQMSYLDKEGESADRYNPRTWLNFRAGLTLFDGAALLVGAVIGSGIFVVPSLIAQHVPEPGLVIGIWVFSGLLVLCGALTLAELGTMLPQSGGLYVYMREAYGPFWAFLYGWTIMLVVIPGSLAALTAAFFLYLRQFLAISVWTEKTLGIGAAARARVHQHARREAGRRRAEPVHRPQSRRTGRSRGTRGRHPAWRPRPFRAARARSLLGWPAGRRGPGDDLDAVCLRRLAVCQPGGRRTPRSPAHRACAASCSASSS